jgi:glycosyltransferase involved in cell wall biosynthesis
MDPYSVIIPAHNRQDMLEVALKSVISQSYEADEIIVIDDGSNPQLQLSTEFKKNNIQIIRIEKSIGAASARNIGLQKARNNIVAFLDDDDEWMSNKMERQIRYLKDNPQCVLVSCGYRRIQNNGCYNELFSNKFVKKYGDYDTFIGSFSFMSIRKKNNQNWLLLDTQLRAFQDWEYFLRMRELGTTGVVEDILVIYNAHNAPRITNTGRKRLMGLRRVFLNHKNKLSIDAQKWVFSRLLFERAQCSSSWCYKLKLIKKSVYLSIGCDLPFVVKYRSIAKRVLTIFTDTKSIESLRAKFLGLLHQNKH